MYVTPEYEEPVNARVLKAQGMAVTSAMYAIVATTDLNVNSHVLRLVFETANVIPGTAEPEFAFEILAVRCLPETNASLACNISLELTAAVDANKAALLMELATRVSLALEVAPTVRIPPLEINARNALWPACMVPTVTRSASAL